ncbi:hypothetical protein ABMA70_00800 [Halobacteriovorax sp. XZX-3]|uniref:hypothetical protein n=1 Tax=unclassified Halobacteriovorax TaxID=2639665 RepID=UPI000CD0C43E|nr:hypothetical protein [Halobacteriovorax sp. DA5]POB14304.1 hypothetical protein C0Z22_04230 [Halobacteriovorax sp. DA5]
MTISNKAHELLRELDPAQFNQYISANFFDDSFMANEEDALKKKALLYSALTIIKKVGPASLFVMTFREAESFLRDNASEHSWPNVLDLKKWFETILQEIQKEFFENALMNNKIEILNWEKLSLQERIQKMALLIDNVNTTLESYNLGQIELFSIEENEVCVDDGIAFGGLRQLQADSLKEIIYDGIAKYLNFSFQSQRIKLVAQ